VFPRITLVEKIALNSSWNNKFKRWRH